MNTLAAEWRREAESLRRRGAEAQAKALESCAADLEAWIREHELEALTLEEAAEEAGLSYHTVQKKVAAGELPNVGRKHRPRVTRRDVHEVLLARREAS